MLAVPRSLLESVLTGVMVFCIIFSVSFVVGRALVGSTDWLPTTGDQTITLAEALRNELINDSELKAVFVASGAITGRVELRTVDVLPRRDWSHNDPWSSYDPWRSPAGLVLHIGEDLPDLAGVPAFVGERFSGSGYTLTVQVGEVAVGEEWTDVRSVILTDPAGHSFFGKGGDCALRLSRAGWITERLGVGSPDRIVRSTFLGELRCTDIPEIRSGSLVSLEAAIRYEP